MVLNKESLLVGWLYLCRDIENTVGDDKRPMELLFKVHHLFQWKQFMFRLPVQPAACSCSNNFSLQSSVASRVSTKLSRVLFNSWHGWSILLFIEKLWIANGGRFTFFSECSIRISFLLSVLEELGICNSRQPFVLFVRTHEQRSINHASTLMIADHVRLTCWYIPPHMYHSRMRFIPHTLNMSGPLPVSCSYHTKLHYILYTQLQVTIIMGNQDKFRFLNEIQNKHHSKLIKEA